jgi:EamA-like transporter family protein
VGARGEAKPCRLEWRNVAIQAAFLFLISYGGLFWAEKTIPSGIASILIATVPAWTALLQVCVLRKEAFRWSLLAGTAFGLAEWRYSPLRPQAARILAPAWFFWQPRLHGRSERFSRRFWFCPNPCLLIPEHKCWWAD